ncbi:hypothetical protein LXL04_013473 [Taraxacum kok-saghyz]
MVYELGHARVQLENNNVAIQIEGDVAGNLHKKRRSGVNNVNKFIVSATSESGFLNLPTYQHFESERDTQAKSAPTLSNPLIGDNGKIYICSEKKLLIFHNKGSISNTIPLKYTCNDITPVFGASRRLYLVAGNRVLRINLQTRESTTEVFLGPETGVHGMNEILGLSVSISSSCVLVNIKRKGLFSYNYDGKLRWSTPPVITRRGYTQGCRKNITDCYFVSPPVIDYCDSNVYMSNNQGEIYAVSIRSPQFKWIQDLSSFGKSFVITAANNGKLYVTVPNRAIVICIDVGTGTLQWQQSIGPLSTQKPTPVSDVNGWISIGSLDGFLYSISPSGVVKKYPRLNLLVNDTVMAVNPFLDCSGYAVYIIQRKVEGKISENLGEYTYVSALKPLDAIFKLYVPSTGSVYWNESYHGKWSDMFRWSDLRSFILDESVLLAFVASLNIGNRLRCYSTRQKLATSCSMMETKHLTVYTGNEKAITLFLFLETILLIILVVVVRFCCTFWRKKKVQKQDLAYFLEKRSSLLVKRKVFDRTITELQKETSSKEVSEKLVDLVREKEGIERKLSTTYSLGKDTISPKSKTLIPLSVDDKKRRSFSSKSGSGRKESNDEVEEKKAPMEIEILSEDEDDDDDDDDDDDEEEEVLNIVETEEKVVDDDNDLQSGGGSLRRRSLSLPRDISSSKIVVQNLSIFSQKFEFVHFGVVNLKVQHHLMVYELGHARDQFENNNNVAIQIEGGVAGNLHKKRRSGVNNVNKFIGNVAKNYMETTVGENWPSDLINHLNNRFPTSIDSIKNFIQSNGNLHDIVSNSIPSPHSSLPDLLVSPVLDTSTSTYPENYMNLGYNHYNPASIYNPEFCRGSSFNGDCGGMKLISPLGVKQTEHLDLITSPEQVSSITACSYGDMISDTEAFDSRAFYQLRTQTQPMQTQQQQPQQPQHVILESSNQISSLQVISSYIMYKDMPADLRKEVPFQNYMHSAVCKEIPCNCSLYLELASHYDKCHDSNCSICGPVRSLYTNKFHLETKKRKIDESESDPTPSSDPSHTRTTPLSDTLPTKYQKMEDVQEVKTEVPRADNDPKVNTVNGEEPINGEQRKNFHQTHGGQQCDTVINKNEMEKVPEKMKIQSVSVSLADFFTADQIRGHLMSFTPQKDVSGNRVQSIGQNRCQLCTMDKLVCAPAPIYCSSCDTRIKRNVGYFRSTNEIGIRHCFCMSCYRGSHGTNIIMRGFSIPKSNLQKAKNDEEKEDSWVLCDRCQCWQHRICGLYNDEKDVEGKAEYICPKCYLEELENGTRVPLPQTNAFGAKDLPKTNLSDHIEERLNKRLNEEREEMAKVSGIELNEVPAVEGLVVRVVVSIEKQLEVRQKFKDILHGEDYPSGFTYRSKKIEGVDVCLFGMCVQEFGSECGGPNQRCVYISYLDSVKYFRPERKSVTGESLRTFVYHEILIGYLEYCKTRGFATCYIWACPLIKGEDYIFYCHPETQRTPKQDKLRQWYKSMLKKGAEDGVVVDYTNLYNDGDGKVKISAARLPYFDGDYWSGAAENIVRKLEVEEKAGGLQSKLPNKRILKAMGQDKPDVAVKDVLVMQKLGQTILPVKENFMIVHLQHICTKCHEVILSGSRWFCTHCKKIQLCSKCFDADKTLTHTCHSGEKNPLSEVIVNNVTVVTKDKDDVFGNSFFETRDAFLNKCQKSHFQFDTLSRAKYSSMMILYHLIHKPPPIKPTCTACHKDVVVERCWHCDICPKYNVCEACYKMKRGAYHPHRLTPPSLVVVVRGSKPGHIHNHKPMTLKQVLDVLMHASECAKIPCCYTECVTMRRLFYHASRCSVRVVGGCQLCKRVWRILKEHSQICKDSDCKIPRCMDIKKHKEVK